MATEKFKALAHFIMHECRDNPSRLGSTRLNKALWFADTYAYAKNGKSITGDAYVKRPKGPVPKNILKTEDELRRNGKIAVQEPEFQFDTRKYISLEAPDTQRLTEDELETARIAVRLMCNATTTDISESTHNIVWRAAAMGEEIPLYATLAGNEGVVTDEVIAWANKSVSARDAH